MNEDWKRGFPQLFKDWLASRLGIQAESEEQCYNQYLLLDNQSRRGLWVAIAEKLLVPSKRLHDWFHGAYIKRFYDDISTFHDELQDISDEVKKVGITQINDQVNQTIMLFKRRHPELRVHTRSTYSFLYTILSRQKTRKQGAPPAHQSPKREEDARKPVPADEIIGSDLIKLLSDLLPK